MFNDPSTFQDQQTTGQALENILSPNTPSPNSGVDTPEEKEREHDFTFCDSDMEPQVMTVPDTYDGKSLLKYSNIELPLIDRIPYVPRSKKISMEDIEYKGGTADVPETPPMVQVTTLKKGQPNHENNNDDAVPKVKMKNLRRSTRIQQRTSNNVTSTLRSASTIWVPSSMLRKRRQWALTNAILAIPQQFFTSEQSIHMSRNQGEVLLSDETTEKLRKYHIQLEHLRQLQDNFDPDVNWKVQNILDHVTKEHQGTVKYFFKVEWHGGDTQWIDMDDLRVHDPIAVIKYGNKKQLLKNDGWEWIRSYLPMEKEIEAMCNALNVVTKDGHRYKFGIRVPGSVKEALAIDKENGNHLWEEAIIEELKQICAFDTFHVVEHGEILVGYKRIPYHIVFDVKFDLRHKARLVAGGHRTDTPQEDVYSGVVSMEAVRLGFIIARMNGLMVCAGDVGNAFLYAITKEKYYVIAGPEFGPDIEGKRLVIHKSLYGLKTSAAAFHEHLSMKLRDMGYAPS